MTGFYGHRPTTSERHHSWELLRRLVHMYPNLPWLIFGDFNEILRDEEKSEGRLRPLCQIQRFSSVVADCALKEVEFRGPLFTWSNGTVSERLDRGFLNPEGASLFPNALVQHLDVGASDHLPLLHNLQGEVSGRKERVHRRFLFESFWTKDEQCTKIVTNTWGNDSLVSVQEKIKDCAENLQQWNKEVIGCVPKKINALKESLQKFPIGVATEAEKQQREAIKEELEKLYSYEETIWKVRSRLNWLQEGDNNTKFFHAYAKGRGRQNKVEGVFNENGVWCDSMSEVQQAFVEYFSNIYRSEGCVDMELVLNSIPCKVTEVVGDSVSEFCLKVLNEGEDLTNVNHIFISMIPKVTKPK
ncbi:uncharacterized protein LOC133737483 [Rosa rugosa]|uniref:uncharacterized protein LOC133737483 n=1 Tax=Rosa rugosa TaxID=74645 RepID=UPI002B401E45|nr:uncharacterized protein LOC133737483 [Rosa rugosa]